MESREKYPMQLTPEIRARIKSSAESTPFSKLVGLVIESIDSGHVVVRLPYRDVLVRSYGIVHGGAIMTLMDVAAGLASATASDGFAPGATNVTIAASTQFVGMVREQDLVATARCTKAGKSISFIDVDVSTADGLVATGAFTFKVTMTEKRG